LTEIAIVGVGGVGGYFGGKLAHAARRVPGSRVSFLARGAHLAAIRQTGLALDCAEGLLSCVPSFATDDAADLPPADLYVLCVKSFDLDGALERLAPSVRSGATILPLLNGVDIAQRVKARVPSCAVLPACAYVGTAIERPGLVKQRGGACLIIFGPEAPGGAVDPSISGILAAAGIKHELRENPWPDIWMKFLFISPFSLVSAEAAATLGAVLASKADLGRVEAIMGEIMAIASAKGIALPSDAALRTIKTAASFPFEATTSFYRDYMDASRKDERDALGSAIIRMGTELGIATPETEGVLAKLESRMPWPI
jgi:2-dehydropantoate 2-reductase